MGLNINFNNGDTVGSYVKVGCDSSNQNNDAVWSFVCDQPGAASINQITLNFEWDNTAAGIGWADTFTYACIISSSGAAGQEATYGSPALIAKQTVSLTGASGSVARTFGGLMLTPGVTYYVRWNIASTQYSTLKAFSQTGVSGSIDQFPPVNTAPYWPVGAAVTLDKSGIIPENTTSVNVSWTPGLDAQGDNTCRYYVYRRSSLGDVLLAQDTYETRLVDTIGAGNQGATYRYEVLLNDSALWASSSISSATVTKNAMTGFTLDHTGSIAFDTDSVLLSWTQPTNTNGDTSFTYVLTNDKVTIYGVMPRAMNENEIVVKIWRTGDEVPEEPYVKLSELMSAFAGSNCAGALTFRLYIFNAYGSNKSDTESVAVDFRTPTGLAFSSYSGGYTYADVLRYLPDQRAVTVNWDPAVDPLGAEITYEVYYKLTSSKTWTTARIGLTGTTTTISPPSGETQLVYDVRIIARSSYNYISQVDCTSLVIDRYIRPIMRVMTKVRSITQVEITLSLEMQSSFADIIYFNQLKYTDLSGTEVTVFSTDTQVTEHTITYSGILETTSYIMQLYLDDTMGIVLGAQRVNVNAIISSYLPMFSIREKGIGINTINDGEGGYIGVIRGKVNSMTDPEDGESGFYNNGARCITEVDSAAFVTKTKASSSICKVTSGTVGETATSSGWKGYTVQFGVTYVSNPLVSLIPTTPFATENIRIVSISTTEITFQVYESTVGFYFGIYWAAVGNLAL